MSEEEISKYLEKSKHALWVAEELLKGGFPADAASKIYYAMFYAAQALLKSSDIEVTRHSAVEAALGYYFAKTGKLDPKYHRLFIEARKIRETADYDIVEEIVEPTINLKLEAGREFLKVIGDIIEGQKQEREEEP